MAQPQCQQAHARADEALVDEDILMDEALVEDEPLHVFRAHQVYLVVTPGLWQQHKTKHTWTASATRASAGTSVGATATGQEKQGSEEQAGE